MKIFYFSAIVLSLALSLITNAQEEMLISVEGQEIDEPYSRQSYQIPKENFLSSSQKTLGEALKKESSIQIHSNYQGISTSSIRGLGNGNILVIWNGIRLNDPLDPSSSFDFSKLKLSGEEKIEIIRGPEASIWGSNSTGAVVLIKNNEEKASKQKDSPTITTEGSIATYDSYGLEGSYKKRTPHSGTLFYGGIFSTRGISSADSRLGNSERDGRTSQNSFIYNELQISEKWRLTSSASLSHSLNDADLRGGIGGDEKGAQDSGLSAATHLNALYNPSKNYQNKTAISYQKDFRYHKNSVEYARYESDFFSAENENAFKLSSNKKLTSSLETQFENGKSNETGGSLNKQKINLGLKNIYDMDFGNLSFKTGLRIEKDFNLNPKLNSSFFISFYESLPRTDTVLHLSTGKAYKSASLYQLYSSYGNPSLQAENVFSYEIGALQGLQPYRSTLETTLFANNLQESIDYDFTKEKYFNGGSKRNYGIENILESKWSSQFKSRICYTWTHTQALRIAEHKAFLSLNYEFSPNLSLNQEASFTGHKKDIDAVNYSEKLMKPYWLFNSHLQYKIKENILARFHVENILNTKYEEIDGFGSPGLYTKLSIRYSF